MESTSDGRKTADLVMRVRPELKLRLENLKRKMDRSVAWLVERCIEEYLPVLESHALVPAEYKQPVETNSGRRNPRNIKRLPALRRSKK